MGLGAGVHGRARNPPDLRQDGLWRDRICGSFLAGGPLHSIEALTAKLAQVLALYGGWGVFAISFLDSSFLSLPLVNDLLLVHIASRSPARAIVLAFECVLGSVLGASTIYGLTRGGWSLIQRKRPAETSSRVRQWLDHNAFLTLLVVSLLPPPVPFKLFLLGAGALRVDFGKFLGALLIGRSIRFVAVAFIGVHYGAQAEAYLRERLGWTALVVAVLAVVLALSSRAVMKRVGGSRL